MRKLWLAWLCLVVAGCSTSKPTEPEPETRSPTPLAEKLGRRSNREVADSVGSPMVTLSAPPVDNSQDPNEGLLSARLSPEQLEQGWVRLFDGTEMTGWYYVGTASWTFSDGMISVDGGEPSLLCTSFQISDFELSVDFQCSARTDSGIFLRSSADPRDSSRDCYELSIAPADSDYPTGSLVKRQKVDSEQVGSVEPNEWHTYRVIVQGDQVKVWLDGKAILEYTDARKLRSGFIGLQYNLGSARFRNILMRPLGAQDLAVNEGWQADWKSLENAGPSFKAVGTEEGLRLQGGPGQLESKEQWDDFVLQATYQVANPDVDSGILFRGLANRLNDAYECQIYHGPVRLGTDKAGIRLQTGALNIPIKNDPVNVRVLASDGSAPTYMTIIADEGQFSTFVNGLLVADVADTRDVSPNPRAGFRREAGTLGLQAANEDCDITFQRLSIMPIARR